MRHFLKDESGQDLIEYALIALFVALGCVAVLGILGTKIGTEFSKISQQLT